MLSLGGFRVGTLARLQYRHVRDDLEKGVRPLHIHVEDKITKGGYGEYDTFLGEEAVGYLQLYLEERRKGKLYGIKKPEKIQDDTPLIRDEHSLNIRSLTPSGIHRIVHNLLLKGSIISPQPQPRYEVRPHSIRKFFRTQLAALGVNTDYIEYMMDHKVSTYHDVKRLGIEKLRQIYARSGISIKPKTGISKVEVLKEFARSLGLDPEKVLVRDALAEPHRIIGNGKGEEEAQISALSEAVKDWLRREILNTNSG
jgi:integrase